MINTDTDLITAVRDALADPDADLRSAASALIVALDEALAIEPCHISGMHDPTHTSRYVCSDQEATMVRRLQHALGITAWPTRLHGPGCGWCHDPSSTEDRRERQREAHRWAGVEIPEALAAPAPDAPRPDDPFWALCHIVAAEPVDGFGWRSFGQLNSHHKHPNQIPSDLRGRRFSLAVDELIAAGLIETQRDVGAFYVRPTAAVKAPARWSISTTFEERELERLQDEMED